VLTLLVIPVIYALIKAREIKLNPESSSNDA